jgi:diguanylate cyclase (GGDEF)-like protein/PAS domain S-box-containing protein
MTEPSASIVQPMDVVSCPELLNALPAAIVVIEADGTIVFANRACEPVLGFAPQDLLGTSLDQLMPETERTMHRADRLAIMEHPAARMFGTGIDTFFAINHKGYPLPVEMTVSPLTLSGRILLIVSITDITARKEGERQLERLALTDALTGLANRVLWYDRCVQAIERARRGTAISVLFLDLDLFRRINNTYGHETGDRVLVEIGQRIMHAVRRIDTVSRFGGDEFVVLLDGADKQETANVAIRIRESIEMPLRLEPSVLHVRASIGVATWDGARGLPAPQDLLRLADRCLYRAKRGGRRRIIADVWVPE